jgi:hypothetical protein
MATKNTKGAKPQSTNPDPITGEPGAHLIGTGIGAAFGGVALGAGLGAAGSTAAAAAALGAAAGPAGVVVGAVAGGLIGKEVAESADPTIEDKYWQENYQTRPYVDKGTPYDVYRPAYRYGWEARKQNAGKGFEEVEPGLQTGWETARDRSSLNWDKAKHAVRDAWDRITPGPSNTCKPSDPSCG